MKEAEFQRWVMEVAQRFHWQVWHVPAPMRATKSGFVGAKEAAGLPDLVMIHDDPPTLIFAEVKGSGGKLSPKQQTFLQLARDVPGVGAYLFEPGLEEMIETMLRTRRLL